MDKDDDCGYLANTIFSAYPLNTDCDKSNILEVIFRNVYQIRREKSENFPLKILSQENIFQYYKTFTCRCHRSLKKYKWSFTIITYVYAKNFFLQLINDKRLLSETPQTITWGISIGMIMLKS